MKDIATCCVFQVAKQLFEPLTMQLIHWFTSGKQEENEEKAALIDAVYVRITISVA